MSQRSEALADRLEQGARALAALASGSRTPSGRPGSRRTGARSASWSITSRPCIRWRSSWRRSLARRAAGHGRDLGRRRTR